MLAIAADAPSDARRMVERNNLNFSVICDTEREVIRAFGLLHKGGALDDSDIAIPAHVLIDRQGRIVWKYISSRIQDRIDPDDVLIRVRESRNE